MYIFVIIKDDFFNFYMEIDWKFIVLEIERNINYIFC